MDGTCTSTLYTGQQNIRNTVNRQEKLIEKQKRKLINLVPKIDPEKNKII